MSQPPGAIEKVKRCCRGIATPQGYRNEGSFGIYCEVVPKRGRLAYFMDLIVGNTRILTSQTAES
jgi:hypothetical protein